MTDKQNFQEERLPIDLRLVCQGFTVDISTDDIPRITADLALLISPSETELIAEALKRLTQYLWGESIYLVKASDNQKRCYWCGLLAATDARKCDGCGAPY